MVLEDFVHDDVVLDLVGVESGGHWVGQSLVLVHDVVVLVLNHSLLTESEEGTNQSLLVLSDDGVDFVHVQYVHEVVVDGRLGLDSIGVDVEDDWVDVLVEEIWVTEEGLEFWVDPVLLELRGGQVDLEEGVRKVLTEEGESPVLLE